MLMISLGVAAVGAYLIYRLVKMSLTTGRKDGFVMASLIGLVILLGVTALLNGAGLAKPKTTPTVAKSSKTNTSEPSRQTSEAERQRRAKEESERKAREEQYIAREKELAANRMPVDEFHARFLATLNVDKMSNPTQRTVNGVVETVTYPLDYDNEVLLMEVSSFGTLKSVIVEAKKLGNGNLDATWLMYAAAVQTFVSTEDMDYIFAQLQMWPPETLVADLKNSRAVTVGNYRFQKNAGSNSISFSIIDVR